MSQVVFNLQKEMCRKTKNSKTQEDSYGKSSFWERLVQIIVAIHCSDHCVSQLKTQWLYFSYP